MGTKNPKMKQFSSLRVLTVKELRPGDVIHSGVIGNQCAVFYVRAVTEKHAVVTLGKSRDAIPIALTSHELRSDDCESYFAETCPLCGKHEPYTMTVVAKARLYRARLVGANVPSKMRFKMARRYGVGERYGAARIDRRQMKSTQKQAKPPEDAVR